MKSALKIITIAIILQFAASCESLLNKSQAKKALPPIDYLENASKINLKNFLNGDLEGFAIVQNEKGLIEKSYTAKVNGKWDDGRGTVQYNFIFNDGKKDSRTWLITMNDEGNYTVIGHDFSSPAQGRQQGNVAQLLYNLTTPYKDKKQKIDFEDNIYLVDSSSAIIISVMKIDNAIVGKSIIALKKSSSSN